MLAVRKNNVPGFADGKRECVKILHSIVYIFCGVYTVQPLQQSLQKGASLLTLFWSATYFMVVANQIPLCCF